MPFVRVARKICFCLFCVLMLTTPVVRAQDIIVKKDGVAIKGNVVKADEESVTYRKPGEANAPVISVPTSKVLSINYENGLIQTSFNTKGERVDSGLSHQDGTKSISDDEQMKKQIEVSAKDVGDQIADHCSGGKVDNYTSEIYWDGVFQNPDTKEITLPMRVKWTSRKTAEFGDWIKGTLFIDTKGKKRWQFQTSNSKQAEQCGMGFVPN
jgi:hypothetical protein